MKTTIILAFAVLVLSAGLYAQTAERMRPGQWSTSTIVGGKTYAASQCISKPDADEMNGDVKKVEAYLRKIIPPEACQITDAERVQMIGKEQNSRLTGRKSSIPLPAVAKLRK